MPSGKLLAASLRENSGIYILASLSNAFLIMSQYLAVSAAVASYLPVDSATAVLIASYGRGVGIGLALFLNSLVFQGILAVLVAMLALASIVKTGWKWAYAFSGVAVSGFVGYWLGAKFLAILEWISTLQDNRVDSSNPYAGLFWFGLAATICYLAMILVLRKSYGKLAERYSAVKGPIGSNSFHATDRLRVSPHRFLDRGFSREYGHKIVQNKPRSTIWEGSSILCPVHACIDTDGCLLKNR